MATAHTLLISLMVLLQLVQGRPNNEATLISQLLTGYDISARPVFNQSSPVVVSLKLSLQSIIGLDEIQQELKSKLWLGYIWTDESLRWNSSAEHGIQSLSILPTRIWRPDITLYDDLDARPNDNLAGLYPAQISSEGVVEWDIPKVSISSCNVDVQYYPWDEQKCILKYTSWTYDGSKVDIVNQSAKGDMSFYSGNSEWSVVSLKAERHVQYYTSGRPFPEVTFTLHVRRKPAYYIFNLILPAIFIMFTAVLVFYLPPDSGEKVGLGVTVLLAMTVFLLLVAESVPKSDTVPLMGKYFAATIMLMAVSTGLTVLILNLHHRGVFGNQVPRWIRVLVLDWMARPLCLKATVDANLSEHHKSGGNHGAEGGHVNGSYKMKTSEKPGNNEPPAGDPTLLAILDVMRSSQKDKREDDKGEACKTDWMLVAAVIDRFLLLLFLALSIIVTGVILSEHPSFTETPIG